MVAAAVAVPIPLLRHTADSAAAAAAAAGWLRSEKAYPHSSRQSFVPCLTVAVEEIGHIIEPLFLSTNQVPFSNKPSEKTGLS